MFTDAQKHALVVIARAAVKAEVTGQTLDVRAAVELPTASGAFVTLKYQGHLRGCLGTLECHRPLAEEVARCAARAAREDPRFDPVRASELEALAVEVSILGPLEPIDPGHADAIVIGRHGLVVEHGSHRGVLLPQVAPEWGWSRDEFLVRTCHKAGLASDAWRHGAVVYRFEAEVFGD